MKLKKYTLLLALITLGISMSCRDESLYPLPYNDRTSGAYLRMYSIASNIFDLNNIAASAFDVDYEMVDENGGANLQEVEFYASFRRGTGLTSEVLVKKIPGSSFAPVPEPTYSDYRRSRIKITANETLTALASAAAPPATWPSGSVGIALPGTLANADQIIYRWQLVMNDGRKFSVLNPQRTNISEANNTPNITTGQFYNAPSTYTMVVRSLLAGSWVGTYNLQQVALWSPNHSVALHQSSFPTSLNQVLFPAQTVNLAVPSNGLSTEREFTITGYRGQSVKMRINLENGAVYIPLQNTGVDCTAEREIYWTYPTAGSFAGSTSLPAGLPQTTLSNRGAYNTAQTGLVAGQVMTVVVDDDADEYGRRNGYCTWVRRVSLTLTKN
jgi:hypothetical protein